MKNDRFMSDCLEKLRVRAESKTHDIVFLRVNAESIETQLYLCMRDPNDYWLSIYHVHDSLQLSTIPNISGLTITNELGDHNKKGTSVRREITHDEPVYRSFLAHLIDELAEIKNAPAAKRVLQKALHVWQEFFKGGAKPLGQTSQLGLAGELATLHDKVLNLTSNEKAIDAWVGPSRAIHDFIFNSNEIEVKTNIGENNRHFTINGENQLVVPKGKQLYLANPIFNHTDDGGCLPDWVNLVREKLNETPAAQSIFDSSLAKAGYHPIHDDHYQSEGLRMSLSRIVIYQVVDGFPRLLPNHQLDFIKVLKYSIEADGCEPFVYTEQLKLE